MELKGGPAAKPNFPLDVYKEDVEELAGLDWDEVVHLLRGRSTSSKFRGVALDQGKWKAQVYWQGVGYTLGSHASEEQAAAAYDIAALYREVKGGPAAKLNFPSDGYKEDMTELAGLDWDEVVHLLRGRKASSKFRGVHSDCKDMEHVRT